MRPGLTEYKSVRAHTTRPPVVEEMKVICWVKKHRGLWSVEVTWYDYRTDKGLPGRAGGTDCCSHDSSPAQRVRYTNCQRTNTITENYFLKSNLSPYVLSRGGFCNENNTHKQWFFAILAKIVNLPKYGIRAFWYIKDATIF